MSFFRNNVNPPPLITASVERINNHVLTDLLGKHRFYYAKCFRRIRHNKVDLNVLFISNNSTGLCLFYLKEYRIVNCLLATTDLFRKQLNESLSDTFSTEPLFIDTSYMSLKCLEEQIVKCVLLLHRCVRIYSFAPIGNKGYNKRLPKVIVSPNCSSTRCSADIRPFSFRPSQALFASQARSVSTYFIYKNSCFHQPVTFKIGFS